VAGIALRATASYLPADTVAVADLPELADLTDTERETCLSLGIERIAVAPDLDAVRLGALAAEQALAEAGLRPDELDALVLIESRAPESLVCSESTRLQALIGADRALAFTVGGLGCASIAPGLLTARGLLAADHDLANVLVVHGSKPATPRRFRHPVTVYGDSGQAVVVAREGPVHVLDILVETNGRYWDLFRVDYRDRTWPEWREECADVSRYSFQLAMETRTRLRDLHGRLLDRNGLRCEDVRHHVGQGLSAGALRFHEESLGITFADACLTNLHRYGHLGPNDTLHNLTTAIDPTPDFGRAVLLNASPSAAWSAILVAAPNSTGDRGHYL
jgi:3-oxoacyl-[acyl-carrier-protein] synthase-3